MSTDHTSMWVSASRDYDAEAAERRFAMAKVAATQNTWSFLAGANSDDEFRARFDLVDDQVKAAVASVSPDDQELLEAVESALHEDFLLLHNSPERIAARDAEAVKLAIETQQDWWKTHKPDNGGLLDLDRAARPYIGDSTKAEDNKKTGWSCGICSRSDGKGPSGKGARDWAHAKAQADAHNRKYHPEVVKKKADLDNAAQPAENSIPGAAEGYVKDVPIQDAPDYGTITEPADFDDSHGLDPNVDATTGGTPYQAAQKHPYECADCGAQFSQWPAAKDSNKSRINPDGIACTNCGSAALRVKQSSKVSVSQHDVRLYQHPAKDGNDKFSYECKTCGDKSKPTHNMGDAESAASQHEKNGIPNAAPKKRQPAKRAAKNDSWSLVPTHVVVDHNDGMTFSHDHDGRTFNADTAKAFVDQRNSELKPGMPKWHVHELNKVSKLSAWDSVSRLDFSNGREAKAKAGDFEGSDFTEDLHDELKHHKKRKKEFAEAAENLLESFGERKLAEIHAPYHIREEGGKWQVVNDKNPPDVKGTFDSYDAAREQQKALYASVPGASEMAERKHKESSMWDGLKDYGHDLINFPRDLVQTVPVFPDLVRGLTDNTPVGADEPHYCYTKKVPGGFQSVCQDGDYLSYVCRSQGEAQTLGDKHRFAEELGHDPTKADHQEWVRNNDIKWGRTPTNYAASKQARTFSQDQRDKLAESGAALEDGSFPIENAEDLENAKHDIGRGSNHSRQTIINHINQRAKALGLPGVGEQKESGLDFLKKIVGPVDKVLNPKPSTAEADDPDYPGESIEMKQFWGTQPTKDDEERWLQ